MGSSSLHHKLYVLNLSYSHLNHRLVYDLIYNTKSSVASLWRLRLDHVFYYIFHIISLQYPFIPYFLTTFPCDICHFAKQSCLIIVMQHIHIKFFIFFMMTYGDLFLFLLIVIINIFLLYDNSCFT